MRLFGKEKAKKHGVLLDHELDGNELCEACDADCCKGFPSVMLSAQEYALLDSLGAKRLEFTLDEKFYLMIENGCEFLVGSRCGIYGQRPRICRLFTCEE